MSKEKNLPSLDPLASAEPVAAQPTTLGKSLDKTDAVYGIAAARCCCATQSSKEGQERLDPASGAESPPTKRTCGRSGRTLTI